MTEKILNRMVGSETTAQMWTSLSEYFTAHNRAKIGQYKTMLRNTKMTSNIDDYLLQIKKIVDTLASIGYTLTPQDHIESIFNGLSKDYDVFITSVNTRTDPYSVAEIEALLLSQSVRIEKSIQDLEINNPEAHISTRFPSSKIPFSHSARGLFPSSSRHHAALNQTRARFPSSSPALYQTRAPAVAFNPAFD